MKKFLRSALAGLAFGACALAGVALAQTITSSLQLSQDGRGLFGVDTNNNLYLQFNRHLLFSLNAAPPPATASTGCTLVANSTDASGQLTGCSGSSATVTFGAAFLTAPRCVASTSVAASQLAITATTGIATITPSSSGAATWTWFCNSVS
jgi:hypothetical protein